MSARPASRWPLVSAIVVAVAVGGGIVAHRLSKSPPANVAVTAEDASDKVAGAANAPHATGATGATSATRAPDAIDAPYAALALDAANGSDATGPSGDAPSARRAGTPPRSPKYALFDKAVRRARDFERGPSVRSRWYEGAGEHDAAMREQRVEKADVVLYFRTDW